MYKFHFASALYNKYIYKFDNLLIIIVTEFKLTVKFSSIILENYLYIFNNKITYLINLQIYYIIIVIIILIYKFSYICKKVADELQEMMQDLEDKFVQGNYFLKIHIQYDYNLDSVKCLHLLLN